MTIDEAGEILVGWLEHRVIASARGDETSVSEVEPAGRFWLGRLATEAAVMSSALGERAERMEPCAIGLRCRTPPVAQAIDVQIACSLWLRQLPQDWRKRGPIAHRFSLSITPGITQRLGRDELELLFTQAAGEPGFSAELRVEWHQHIDGTWELQLELVNTTPQQVDNSVAIFDTRLYECSMTVSGLVSMPFVLASLPDSFRYDRRVDAYGINCAITLENGVLATADHTSVARSRPQYWSTEITPPDLRFAILSQDPFPSLESLGDALAEWGETSWGDDVLDARALAEGWSTAMRRQAAEERLHFVDEVRRFRHGIAQLREHPDLLRSFRLMNEAMAISAAGKYNSWRPFQVGFLVCNLPSVLGQEKEICDVVWFATGGGKTETYLGLLITAALHDRMRGKLSGITAWSRFPLRMLSLQQTQRFADAMAGAELVRRRENLGGDGFTVGFFVGNSSTPNRLTPDGKDGPDPDDDSMPGRFQVLMRCSFCRSEALVMRFDRRRWVLEHTCPAPACPSGGTLPFFVVDDEVFRFLPTVVVGTLDKAALLSMSASMRGFVSHPLGLCPVPGHGYTYAQRTSRPTGCLVPDCTAAPTPLAQAPELFAPTFRLQDELHLLRDTLGAVDAHYESLFDQLQEESSGSTAKILASSATLTGYEHQTQTLFQRQGRVFPTPPPLAGNGFWTSDSDALARRFVALAPRGVTVEYAHDRTITELQRCVRALVESPGELCRELGIEPELADELISLYGTNVVYGNTLRDIEAFSRSFETQIDVQGDLNHRLLTGRVPFDEVRATLDQLESPPNDFYARIHLIAASAMMSHGVDIDRLNTMVLVGLPLGTAEFIQATARVGRTHPGVVFVIPKIARERDAGVFRAFRAFVEQGDRFVDAIPITRRSRRVLERTLPGIAMARLLHVHEPSIGRPLTTTKAVLRAITAGSYSPVTESDAVVQALGLTGPLDAEARADVQAWFARFFAALSSPGADRFPAGNCPGPGPMRSLRDVEAQAPIIGTVRGD
jgi:hypothetical protein